MSSVYFLGIYSNKTFPQECKDECSNIYREVLFVPGNTGNSLNIYQCRLY